MDNFGPKIIKPKPIFAELPSMFQHRDKKVREATKAFFVEAYCWVGPSVKAILEKVPKIEQSIKECEDEWKDKKTKVNLTFFVSEIWVHEKWVSFPHCSSHRALYSELVI